MRPAVIVLLSLATFAFTSPTTKPSPTKVFTKCIQQGVVALTFDDGPSEYLRQVSDALTTSGGKGTFFINGKNYACIYDDGPASSVRYAFQCGHQIASHTWSHPNLTSLNRDQIVQEFSKVDDAIEQITGVRPAFMRPPYGEYNDLVLDVAGERGQSIVMWDFDAGDTIGLTAEKSNDLYVKLASKHPTNVLALNHDVKQTTAQSVVPHAIYALQKAGYKLVTVAECLGLAPYQLLAKHGARRNATATCEY